MNPHLLENRLYRSRWDDGLLDVFIGVALLAIGVSWMNEQTLPGALIPSLLVPFWPTARKRWVLPRTGSVTFRAERRHKETNLRRTLVLAGVLAFILGMLSYVAVSRAGGGRSWVAVVIPAFPALLLALPAFFVAQMLGVPRLHLYGIVLLAGAGLLLQFETNPGVPMALGGAVALAVGLVLLLRFFRTHPASPAGKLP